MKYYLFIIFLVATQYDYIPLTVGKGDGYFISYDKEGKRTDDKVADVHRRYNNKLK